MSSVTATQAWKDGDTSWTNEEAMLADLANYSNYSNSRRKTVFTPQKGVEGLMTYLQPVHWECCCLHFYPSIHPLPRFLLPQTSCNPISSSSTPTQRKHVQNESVTSSCAGCAAANHHVGLEACPAPTSSFATFVHSTNSSSLGKRARRCLNELTTRCLWRPRRSACANRPKHAIRPPGGIKHAAYTTRARKGWRAQFTYTCDLFAG